MMAEKNTEAFALKLGDPNLGMPPYLLELRLQQTWLSIAFADWT